MLQRIRQIQEQALQKMRVKIDKRNEPSAALAEWPSVSRGRWASDVWTFNASCFTGQPRWSNRGRHNALRVSRLNWMELGDDRPVISMAGIGRRRIAEVKLRVGTNEIGQRGPAGQVGWNLDVPI